MDSSPKPSARHILTTLSERRILTSEITFADKGSKNGGAYSDVYLATLERTSTDGPASRVAVKKFRYLVNGDTTEEKFLGLFANELSLLDQLCHPNIVKITGFVEDTKNRTAWLIFPWEGNGNMREFLRSGEWELPERAQLIFDVACGLEYLHRLQPPICHGDLKSLNILINSSYEGVITDFGSARVVREAPGAPRFRAVAASQVSPELNGDHDMELSVRDTALSLTGPAWSFRWAPPEVINGADLDLASDIWALGWIAWEAVTGNYPFEDVDLTVHIATKIVEGQLPSLSDHHHLSHIHRLCSVMKQCWRLDPKKRPSAAHCLVAIQWIPRETPVPKNDEQPTTRSVDLLVAIGENHRVHGRAEDAIKAFEQGLEIAQSTANHHEEANILLLLGETHRDNSDVHSAGTFLSRALALYKQIGNRGGQAHALRALGILHYARSQFDEAKDCLDKALDILQSLGDELGCASVLLFVGKLCLHQDNSPYTAAETAFNRAMPVFTTFGDLSGQATAAIGLAEIRILQARYQEAKLFIMLAVITARQIDYKWAITQGKSLSDHIDEMEASPKAPEPSHSGDDVDAAEVSTARAESSHDPSTSAD